MPFFSKHYETARLPHARVTNGASCMPHGSLARILAVAASALILPWTAGGAQLETGRAVITGTIRIEGDSTPLSDVEVYIAGSRERTTTDAHGSFHFAGIYPGRYEVRARRLGYEQLVKFVTVAAGETNANTWTMRPVPQQLAEVRVLGRLVQVPPYLRDAYRRAAVGFGDFILPEDIERRNAFHTVDLLDAIPGAHVAGMGVEFARCNDSQIAFGPGGGRDKIQVYIDGNLATRMMTVEQALESVNPKDVAIVEVYRGVARIPGEFIADACAVI